MNVPGRAGDHRSYFKYPSRFSNYLASRQLLGAAHVRYYSRSRAVEMRCRLTARVRATLDDGAVCSVMDQSTEGR